MMISKTLEQSLCSLLFETTSNYSANLQTLLQLIEQTPTNAIVLAHEVCLTGFDYENIQVAAEFSREATQALLEASQNRTVVLTMLEKREGEIYNIAKVFHNGVSVYERAKARLFRLAKEHEYMSEGRDDTFDIVSVNGVKIAILICFELRFKEMWKMAEGADLILTPSWWGKPRAEHFTLLTRTLAVMNECYVMASDAKNVECTGLSSIITPQGEVVQNGNKPCLVLPYKQKNIALMRRYINVGIE